jgi:hypothetical protein
MFCRSKVQVQIKELERELNGHIPQHHSTYVLRSSYNQLIILLKT